MKGVVVALALIIPAERVWADTPTHHSALPSNRAWQSRCLKRLERASNQLGQRLPIFAKYRTYVRDRAIGLEEKSDDPSYVVEIADSDEPGAETAWASIERGISRQHGGKSARIQWVLRIYDQRREAVYAAFRAAVDQCLDDAPG
jgi:hypothetical protein